MNHDISLDETMNDHIRDRLIASQLGLFHQKLRIPAERPISTKPVAQDVRDGMPALELDRSLACHRTMRETMRDRPGGRS